MLNSQSLYRMHCWARVRAACGVCCCAVASPSCRQTDSSKALPAGAAADTARGPPVAGHHTQPGATPTRLISGTLWLLFLAVAIPVLQLACVSAHAYSMERPGALEWKRHPSDIQRSAVSWVALLQTCWLSSILALCCIGDHSAACHMQHHR